MTRQTSSQMGANRTGIGMSPVDSREMISAANASGDSILDGHGFEEWRIRFADEAESIPIGTVPPPSTLKGAVKSMIKMVTGKQPVVFVDHLGARLGFERTGARLYEAVLAKTSRVSGDGTLRTMLEQFRDQEIGHFQIVREAMDALGVDPTAQTPAADVVGLASMGLIQIVTDPRTSIDQCLEALLIAELSDHDGWSMLMRMADGMGENDLSSRFSQALGEERQHLATVRSWLYERVDAEIQRDQPRH
jgi:rubrerythrin